MTDLVLEHELAEVPPAPPEFRWKATADGGLLPFYFDGKKEIQADWMPQAGSQTAFLTADSIFEVLYEGTRGPGKTDALLMDFVKHVGKGWGAEWRGILFRKTYPQLSDVIAKSKKWFKRFFPSARYNKVEHTWTFATGETLLLRHMNSEDDYWSYHGHAYPWIAWEELCSWNSDKCYKVMMSCSRSTQPGMPRCYRSTTNPYGPGHNWVKARFRLPQWRGRVITDSMVDGTAEPPRVAIHGSIYENKILLTADPDYISRIKAAARNPSELAAWIEGSWDIVAGGMFDDLWRGDVHVVSSFPIEMIPRGWRIDRSLDWGESKPFAVCWFAESNGEPFTWQGVEYGRIKGDLFMIREWYGWNGTRNEGVRMLAKDVAKGIKNREEDWGLNGITKPGPSDAAIHDPNNGKSIEKDMSDQGIRWQLADKSPGSRKQGWQQVRKMLKAALPLPNNGTREDPGFWVCDCCTQTQETFPNLARDDKDLDDVDTDEEDHIGDVIRYRARKKLRGVRVG